MNDALAQLMADKHWPYIWPCFALAALVFAGLTTRAATRLRYWKTRAGGER